MAEKAEELEVSDADNKEIKQDDSGIDTRDGGEQREAPIQATREQLEQAELSNGSAADPSTVLNVYYGKLSGGDSRHNKRRRSAFHCNVKRDVGVTKADSRIAKGEQRFICLWFARGMCSNGKDCTNLHRLPTSDEDYDPSVDCFGRAKFADYRQDYKGIGSFMHVNKTLFVGFVGKNVLDKVFHQKFGQFGAIERVRTRINGDSKTALVSFRLESTAQFAKEAMTNQTITGKETLVVQWDNKGAVSRMSREAEQLPDLEQPIASSDGPEDQNAESSVTEPVKPETEMQATGLIPDLTKLSSLRRKKLASITRLAKSRAAKSRGAVSK